MKKRYQDLENLIFKGFIPLKVQVNGLNLVLKTVNENEYEHIKLISGFENDPSYTSFFNINYLFYSIYMVDGVSILKNREDRYYDFFEVLGQFPSAFFKNIYKIIEDLNKRQHDCSIQVEQYSYENESRYRWESVKNYLINSSSQTSIPGTELLGMNQFQKYWTTLNLREDRTNKFKEEYSLVKFLASFTDPKAVKKVEQRDKAKEEEEDKRRERLRVLGTEEEVQYLSNPTDTREGLVEALEKQMRGEKDEHDLFIEAYEKRIRAESLKRINEMRKVRESRSVDLEEDVRTITKDELIERLEKIKKRKEKSPSNPNFISDQDLKIFQMSNVSDEDIIREEDFISEEDYAKLLGDESYKRFLDIRNSENNKKRIEEEYKKQQKKLASRFDIEELDFPHIKR